MKNVSFCRRVSTVGKFAALALVAEWSLSSVAAQPIENITATEQPSQRLIFTLDANGNITLKNSQGENVGQKCSINLNSDPACSIFLPGNPISINQTTAIEISPSIKSVEKTSLNNVNSASEIRCYLIKRNGVYIVIPNAEYCAGKL